MKKISCWCRCHRWDNTTIPAGLPVQSRFLPTRNKISTEKNSDLLRSDWGSSSTSRQGGKSLKIAFCTRPGAIFFCSPTTDYFSQPQPEMKPVESESVCRGMRGAKLDFSKNHWGDSRLLLTSYCQPFVRRERRKNWHLQVHTMGFGDDG